MLWGLILLLISLSYFLFMYISWNEDYWIKQKIPFIEPKKLFGNIRDVVLMKKTIGEVYQDIYNKLEGKPLGGFFKMRQPILMIRDPDLIGEVLTNKFNYFHDNDIHIRRDADPILKMNPFLAKGSTWELTRSVLKPLNQNELLEGMLQVIKRNCQNLVQYLEDQTLPVEVKELCSKYTSDVIASCALGYEVNSFKKTDTQFWTMSAKLLKKDIKSNAALLMALYAPLLGNYFGFRIISRDLCDYFIQLISDKCKFRVQEGIRGKDFLQRLIDINKESEAIGEGAVYNYDQITGHCMTIFLDGYSMTSHPLSFCLHQLAMNPKVQNKLHDELKNNGLKSVDSLSQYLLHGLEYLDMVVDESLRMHPPKETITRLCTSKAELYHEGHAYNVDLGTPITVPVHALHMDPKYFTDPMEFKPERFSKEQSKTRHPFVYLPFGAGPRICPGAKFAKLILKAALIAILLSFEIVPRGSIHNLENEPLNSLISEPKGAMWLRFKPKCNQ